MKKDTSPADGEATAARPTDAVFMAVHSSTTNVIAFPGCTPKGQKKRQRVPSQYQRYDLPFFDRKALKVWAVQPSGDFAADDALGKRYALEF